MVSGISKYSPRVNTTTFDNSKVDHGKVAELISLLDYLLNSHGD
jgi:hypothetical protein